MSLRSTLKALKETQTKQLKCCSIAFSLWTGKGAERSEVRKSLHLRHSHGPHPWRQLLGLLDTWASKASASQQSITHMVCEHSGDTRGFLGFTQKGHNIQDSKRAWSTFCQRKSGLWKTRAEQWQIQVGYCKVWDDSSLVGGPLCHISGVKLKYTRFRSSIGFFT